SSDVLGRGHLDYVVRLAIECGVTPMQAIQMGSINTARMYKLDHKIGSIAPGRFADILFVDDLNDFRPARVMTAGRIVAENGKSVVAPVAPERTSVVAD
ncbi:amidohydrolase family protein, partial [Streptococcus anginosus]|nr:amidohydrolase family protein [Streptococcus anginosus]